MLKLVTGASRDGILLKVAQLIPIYVTARAAEHGPSRSVRDADKLW